MRFSMIAADFAKHIQRMAKVTPTRTTYPILSTVLFKLEGNELSMRATDMELDFVLKLLVEGEEDGEICVPLRLLMEITQVMGDVPLTFEANEQRVTLKTSAGSYSIFGRDPAEFPQAPLLEETHQVKLPLERLAKLIKKTRPFVSQNEMKPALMGVLFEFKDQNLQAVATDGRRLVKYTMENMLASPMDLQLLLAPKFLDLLSSFADAQHDEVTLTVGRDHIRASIPDYVLTARLINEKYPDYNAVIPTSNDKVFTADRNALMETVRRVAVFANKVTHMILVQLRAGMMTISTEDPEFGTSAKEELLIDYSGPDFRLGYNAMYLRDILGIIDSEQVLVKLGTEIGPGTIEPAQQSEGEELFTLLMPIRLEEPVVGRAEGGAAGQGDEAGSDTNQW